MKVLTMVAATAASLFLAGCAGTGGAEFSEPQVHSGFLPDYAKLQPVEGREGALRHIDRSVNLQPYTKLYIDPIQVFVNADSPYKGVQPDAVKRITDYFHKAFVDAVTPAYQVVGAPGPGVLRVRLAITGVQPVSPPLGVTDFIPIKAVYNVGREVAGKAPRVAELTAEMEVLDPQNRQVAAAVVTRKSDRTLPQGEQITWGELSPVVYAWARQFRLGLDDVRGVPTK